MRRLATTVVLVACAATATPKAVERSAPLRTWRAPSGLFEVDLPGAPTPRDVAELTGVGNVNFQVFAIDHGGCSCRVAGFAYPLDVSDAAGEADHAARRQIARMNGTVTASHALPSEIGVEVAFTVEAGAGRGVSRVLVTAAPSRRISAFCIGPSAEDFGACAKIVESLRVLAP